MKLTLPHPTTLACWLTRLVYLSGVFGLLALSSVAGQAQAVGPVAVISAASSKADGIAPNSIVAVYGVNLATTLAEAPANQPLPTTLAGTTVFINGRAAQLFFVSSGQVNLLVPEQTAPGTATIEVRAGDGALSRGTFPVRQAAPGIFTFGTLPAGLLVRVRADGSQVPEQYFDCASGECKSKPIDLGPEGEALALVFFATGLGQAATRVVLGGQDLEPLFAGPQGLAGLDQINVLLPRTLIGVGRISLMLYADGYPSNSVELEFAYRPGTAPPQVNGFNAPAVLAGETLTINGSGFSQTPGENQVRIGEVQARIVNATANQLTIEVPVGVKTGPVTVKTPQGDTASATEIVVRTSISGIVTDTADPPRPLRNVQISARTSNVTRITTSNEAGAFVLPDVEGTSADLLFDGTTAEGATAAVPFPKFSTKMRIVPRRDNRMPAPVALQLVTGPGTNQNNLVSLGKKQPSGAAPLQAQQTIRLETDGVALEIPRGSELSNRLNLTVVNQSRLPARLPAALFSQRIAQITPFGATINPGAKLSFPNPDGLPALSTVKLYKYDPTSSINSEEAFKEAGLATVSANGQLIETVSDAIKEATYYFVATPQAKTTAIGRVTDNAQPVQQAIIRVRGQSDFTDGNGGFAPREAAVKDGDTLTAETSYQRSRNGTLFTVKTVRANPGGLTNFDNIPVNLINNNQPPSLTVPVEPIVLNPGEVRNVPFTAFDPEDKNAVTIQLVLSPTSLPDANPNPTFFTNPVAPAPPNNEGIIQLAPGPGDVGEYALKITVQENQGDRLNTTKVLTIIVQGKPGEFTLTSQAVCDTVAPSGPAVRLSWTPAVRAQSYDVLRNGVLLKAGLTGLQYNDKSVEAGATYNYRVVARNAGLSQDSNTINVPMPVTICGTATVTVALGAPVISGDTATFPLEIGDLSRRGVIAYEFDLAFDPAVLEYLSYDKENTLSSAMNVVPNTTSISNMMLLRVAAYVTSVSELGGNGRVLLQLRFRLRGGRGDRTSLVWQKFILNENNPSVTVANSNFVVP